MSGRLLLAAPAFLVTVMGLSIAVAGRAIGVWPALFVALGVWILGLAAGRIAEYAFLPGKPKTAVLLFTVCSLCPGIAAAMAIALILYLNANFDADAIGTTGLDKEMLKTTVAAFTALLTASFIKAMDDADEAVIGERVRDAFYNRFVDTQKNPPTGIYPVVVGQGSRVEAWLFEDAVGGIEGWGWRARWRRAREIAIAMDDPAEKALAASYRQSQASGPPPAAAIAPPSEGDAANPLRKIERIPPIPTLP